MSGQMVTMNVMLAIHCKRTSYVDLHKPLKNYIRQQFSDRDAADAEEDLSTVQGMRHQVERQGEGLEERRELLQRYYRALTVMESRFPIGPEKPPLNSIYFTWQDAFKTSKKASQCNIYFEKAGVVFNLAATLSQLGLAVDRSTQQGLKSACNQFAAAAGTFGFLRDNLSPRASGPGTNSTVDITVEACGMLERLMLGQAQECFFEKAIMDGKPASLRARIAMQVGMFYEEANAALVLPPLSTHFDRPWVANIQSKASLFQAEALYHLSLDLHEKEEIAEEIARLRAAKAILGEARKNGKGTMQPLLDGMARLEGMVSRALDKAEVENDKVYLMRVPAPGSLPPISPALLATPVSPEEQLNAANEKLFASIIPDSRTKDLSRYTDMVDSVIRTQNERLQTESELAKVKVKEMDLPELLQVLDGKVEVLVPPKLREDVEAAMTSGGPSNLQAELAQLQDLRRVNEGMLAALQEVLDGEARDDASIRMQFGSRWNRPQSSTLTKSLTDRAHAFASNLKQAGQSDVRTEKELKDAQDLLSILTHTRIEDAIPRISRPILAVHGDDQALIGRIRQLLNELEALGAQRAGLEEKLREMKRKDNIMPQLMNTAPGACEELFRKELAKYDPVVKDVEHNVAAQKRVLDEIKTQMDFFRATFNIPQYKADLTSILNKLESAAAKYKELSSNIHEGLKFYVALQDAISALKQQCDDFVMTRNIQSKEYVEQLQRQLAGLNFAPGTHSQPPPPGPPPPSHSAPGDGPHGYPSYPASGGLPQSGGQAGSLPPGAHPKGYPYTATSVPNPNPSGGNVGDAVKGFIGNFLGNFAHPPGGPQGAPRQPSAPSPGPQAPPYYSPQSPGGYYPPAAQGPSGHFSQSSQGAPPAYGIQSGMYSGAPQFGGGQQQYPPPSNNPYPPYSYGPNF